MSRSSALFSVTMKEDERDVKLWNSIMDTPLYPLRDLLPEWRSRALRNTSHPYQIPCVNTETFKKCFINRRPYDF